MSLQESIDKSRNIKPKSLNAYMISLRKIYEKLDTDAEFDDISSWLIGKNIEKIINLSKHLPSNPVDNISNNASRSSLMGII